MDFLDVLIPEESSANLELADPRLVNYYEGLSNRHIWVEDEITSDINEITKKILWWNSEDEDKDISVEERIPVKIFISSCGGELYPALGLTDIITISKTPIYTINAGLAASSGCILLLSGHKRFATKHSTALWHAGSAGLDGTMEQIQSATKHFDSIENKMRDYFIDRTNVDIKKYKRQKDKDWYFDATEQLESGIVNKIVTDIGEII